MTTQPLDTTKMFALLDDAETQFTELISSSTENEINRIPYEKSWTAAQVAAHIAKVNTSIAKLLSEPTKVTDREPGERVQELKKIFLDFTVKFQSQQAILPTQEVYSKEALIEELKTSFTDLKAAANITNLAETFQHHALGETTKFEMVYLAVYHSLRHVHQLRNIYQKIQKKG